MLNLAFIYDYNENKWVKCTEPSYVNNDIEQIPYVLIFSYCREDYMFNIEAYVKYIVCPKHRALEEVRSLGIRSLTTVAGCHYEGIIGYCKLDCTYVTYGAEIKYVPIRWRIFQRSPHHVINISCDCIIVKESNGGCLQHLKTFYYSINPLKGKTISSKLKKNGGNWPKKIKSSYFSNLYNYHASFENQDFNSWKEITGISVPSFIESEISAAVEESIFQVYGIRPSVLSKLEDDEKKIKAYIERPFDLNIVYLKPFFSKFIGKDFEDFDKVFPFSQTDNYQAFCKMLDIRPPKSLRKAYTYTPYAVVWYMIMKQWGITDINYMQELFYYDGLIWFIPIEEFYYDPNTKKVECNCTGDWEDVDFYRLWLKKKKGNKWEKYFIKLIKKDLDDGMYYYKKDILHSFRVYFDSLSDGVKDRLLEDGLTLYVHDAISWEITAKANNWKNVRVTYHELVLPYQCNINGYEFRLVTNTSELRSIGLALCNCVATYRDKVINHESIILYVQHNGKCLACIELREGRYIVQALGDKNSRLFGELLKVCRFWMKHHQLVDSEGYLSVPPSEEADDIKDAVVATIPYHKSIHEMNLMELVNINPEDIKPGYYLRLGKMLGEEYTHSVKAPAWLKFCDEQSELLYSLPEGKPIFDGAFEGKVEAMRALAFMYYYGHGIKRDWNKTIAWIQKAINLGSKEARKDKYTLEKAMDKAFLPLDCVTSTALNYIRDNLHCNEKKIDSLL